MYYSDPAFAAKLLDHAKQLYAFGLKYTGKYSDHLVQLGQTAYSYVKYKQVLLRKI